MKPGLPLKVTYIISDVHKSLQLEWVAVHMKKTGVALTFILIGEIGDTPFSTFLAGQGFPVFKIRLRKTDFLVAFLKTCYLLFVLRPDVVHTHLQDANRIGLFAAWCTRIRKRVYTRHHSAFHHHYFPRFVWMDRFASWLATDVIVLCEKAKEVVRDWEKTPEKKIHLIPHGFDLRYFDAVDENRIKSLRAKYGLNDSKPVIGVIARYADYKGIQYIIPAFRSLLAIYPDAHLVLANAQGDYAPVIKNLLLELPSKSYTEISFETDLITLYSLFTIYVHAPVDLYSEAFGQTYVEALASGIPSVFTLSGIACDFVQHERNALVAKHKDEKSIFQSMVRLLGDPDLRNTLTAYGLQSVRQFDISIMGTRLEQLYSFDE